MPLLQNLPVKWKLTWFSILSSSIALALACGSFLVYERITFRDAMVRNLSTHAQVIAFNVGSAVLFNDPAAATETLAALRAEPHITAVRVYTTDGKLFASYLPAGPSEQPALLTPAEELRGYRFESKQLVLSRNVIADGVSVGKVYLQSDLREMDERVLRYASIVLVVLLASLVLGGLISSRLQRIISQPILDLVDVARSISTQKNYALRVAADSRDELGLLGKSFNEMLAQIETRDGDLHRAHHELERRVEERTEELRKEILERRRLEQQLRTKNEELETQNRQVEQATRLKSEFLANMSHELRTPLNAIIGFSELMHEGRVGAVSDTQKEYLGDILTSGQHLLQLINDILDLSKVEAGKMEFRPERVQLPSVIGEVREILRTLAANKRLHISTEVDPSVSEVVVDAGKLKQVLYNFLSNALKFTPEEGSIAVRVVPEGADKFCLEVEDTGIGIQPTDLDRLFKEFQQLDSTSSKKYAGTGLGLALTKRMLEAQGGSVRVRSTPGKGSVFSAILPRVAELTAVPVQAFVHSIVPADAPLVLVVEDEARDLAWTTRVLSGAGYRVQGAVSGREAIARIGEQRFVAIILDLLLPDESGWDVLHAIRREGLNRDVPVIVASVVAEKGIGAGFAIQDYLVKPLRADELLATLRSVQRQPSSERPAILVVDDDPKALKLMELHLQQLGCAVIARMSGKSGLEAVAEVPLGAVVLDLTMPEMDGFEFLVRLRQMDRGRTLPVIVWTSKDLTTEERDRLASAAQALILKGQTGAQALLDELKAHLTFAARSAPAEAATMKG